MRSVISYWAITGGSENRRPVAEAMAEARSAGFDGIELAIGTDGVLSIATSQAECAAIGECARRQGLCLETVASGMSWSCSPTHPDPVVRERAIAAHEAALQRVAWVGAKAMLYVPGAITIPWDASYPAVPYDHAVAWAREGVQRLARTAEAVGVDLCIENVWNGLFYSPLEFAQFIDSIASVRIGAYFDVGNVLGYHQHPQDWIRILGSRIRRIHLKDFRRQPGGMQGFCDLLTGDVPYVEVMAALRDIGYDSTLVAEVMPPRPDLLPTTSRALRTIMAMG